MPLNRAKTFFATLQDRLENGILREAEDARLHGAVSLASIEAAALAWTTGFPLLVMPELFEEKLQKRLLWQQRQDHVQLRAEALLEVL
jgi:hypothetical protein